MLLFLFAIILIIAGGILPIAFRKQFQKAKLAGVVGISVGCIAGLVHSGYYLFHPVERAFSIAYLNTFSLSFKTDSLSAFFLIAIFVVSLLAAVYSLHYLTDKDPDVKVGFSYLFFSILIAAMAMVVTADNMMTFMLSWELMSLSSFFLVIYHHEEKENRKSGYLYFVFSHVGAMFIFAAFGLMYHFTGSFDFITVASMPDAVKIITFVLFFIGFGSKAGVFPFHIWLPHAHPAAPTHISAVMSGVMIKTGIYGIIKMYLLLNLHSQLFGGIVIIAGMVSGIMGVVYALGQHDIKRLLAYHSVENIGIILIGVGVGMLGLASGNPMMTLLGFSGGLLHVLNHSIFKSLLFMGAGVVIQKTGTRTISALGGLLKTLKITGVTFLIGSLAITGLPPFNGFVSEFFVYVGGFNGVGLDRATFILSHLAIISLAIIGGLALACFTKVMGIVFQGEPRHPQSPPPAENEPMMLWPMIILAGACVLIGVFPRFFIQMALQGSSSLLPDYSSTSLEPFLQMTTNISIGAAVMLIVCLMLWGIRHALYKDKTVTASGTWGCGFTQPTPKMQYTGTSFAASIIDFFKPVIPKSEHHSGVRGVFPKPTSYDSHVHDLAERHMGTIIVRPILLLFDKLRWIQHGDIHLYIGYILLTIIILLFFV